jgi:DnaJ-domain-containing protein 1
VQWYDGPVARASIPGLGPAQAIPLINMAFDPTGTQLSPEDYFVLTRVDGHTSLGQIVTISGLAEEQAVASLMKLRQSGALYFQGETPAAAKPAPATERSEPPTPQAVPEPLARDGTSGRVKTPVIDPTPPPTRRTGPIPSIAIDSGPIAIDPGALAEVCDLNDEQKRAILYKHGAVQKGTLFDVLDVGPEADKRTIKRAYFKVSKDFHPDRYFGKNLGSYRARLDAIFAAVSQAYQVLEDDGKRAEYVAQMTAAGPATQSPKEHAAKLFQKACREEVLGQLKEALLSFAAAVRQDPQPRYLRRAAEAALRAQELRSAEEYAKKAAELDPRDAVAHRTLAKVLRAERRFADARRELELAHRLDPASSHIAAELEELKKLG